MNIEKYKGTGLGESIENALLNAFSFIARQVVSDIIRKLKKISKSYANSVATVASSDYIINRSAISFADINIFYKWEKMSKWYGLESDIIDPTIVIRRTMNISYQDKMSFKETAVSSSLSSRIIEPSVKSEFIKENFNIKDLIRELKKSGVKVEIKKDKDINQVKLVVPKKIVKIVLNKDNNK